MHCGIETDDFCLSVLCYADDIVVISESEVNLQKMLDYIHSWCRKWRLRVNTNKSKIIHFRPKRRQRTQFLCKTGNINLDIVTVYKYLGLYFDEFMDFKYGINVLSEAAGRS